MTPDESPTEIAFRVAREKTTCEYDTTRIALGGVVHIASRLAGMATFVSCCGVKSTRKQPGIDRPGALVTCLVCVSCSGCIGCMRNMFTPETTAMGKWKTARDLLIWPFEMDHGHVQNAIDKLMRDEDRFKKNWAEWVAVLEAEQRLRESRRGFGKRM